MEGMRPSLGLRSLMREGRVLNELLAFRRGRTVPARTAQPRAVLLIPGFLAGDLSLYPLADRLRSEGHNVFFAGIWSNITCSRRQIERLGSVLQETAREANDKVIVIGHSLGGIYARALARRFSELVAHTFILGSPIKAPLANSNPFVKMLFIATRRRHSDGTTCLGQLSTLCGVHLPEPPAVPSTLIYSKRDNVVHWPACIESAPHIEAVEVHSTHCGIPYNLDTLKIISDRIRRVGRTMADEAGSADSHVSVASAAQGH